MDAPKIVTLLVLLLAVLALMREWLPVGLVAILAPLSLVLLRCFLDLRLIEPEQMWAGLGHPAVVAVGAMFVVSAGLSRTGAVGFLGHGLSRLASTGRRRIVGTMMVAVAVMSAFINNTTVVLVCLPVVLAMCERIDHPPSRYLIPLSFASIFGGMMTLVGTSTNLVVAQVGRTEVQEVYQEDLYVPGMWDFFPVGIVFVAVGVVYMIFFGLRLLPDRVALSMTLARGMTTEYVTEAEILQGSALVGRKLGDVAGKYQLRVLQLIRGDVIEIPDKETLLEAEDILLVKGRASQIIDLSTGSGTALLPEVDAADMKARQVGMTLAEVIVPPRSRWVDKRVADIGFRSRYGVSVIAVQRHGHHIRQKVGELQVEPADMLLVQGTVPSLRNLRSSENLILIEGVQEEVKVRRMAPLALLVMGGFVFVVSTGILDIATGAVTAAAAMVLTRCLTLREAYQSADWNVLFLLAGFLAMGVALNEVGLAADAANLLLGIASDQPLWLVIGGLYLVTATLSDVLSNTATAALMIPIVVKTAYLMEANPEPFLMTVAFAASAAFLTPVGYQTNLLVFAPGGYRFKDFIVVGLPLRVVFTLLAAVLIPVVYPA
ncbi:MAG: hypothetical protein CMJ83_09230 [Planctomycetes bacterium]|nr:hypothetical protein [Planctomycetota bacterium]